MQQQPIVVRDIPPARIRGLGVCDAYVIELQDVQVPWLIDELEERRGPLEEAFHRVRPRGIADEEDPAVVHELRQLRGMRDQLPASGAEAAVMFVCPGAIAGDLIQVTTRNVITELGELVDGSRRNGKEARARLEPTLAAATAWVQTLLSFQAVEAFDLDPSANPLA
jgi:hypothetical protein